MNDNQPFDYEGRARAVVKTQRFLQFISREDLDDPEFGATQDDRVRIWREALDRAYPPGFWEAFSHIRDKNTAGLPLIIEFLEADPWFFRTGYIKERLIRHIIRFELSPEFAIRLQNVVLTVVDKRYRREFRAYCQLARKVDSPEFRRKLSERLLETDLDIRRRAEWVLEALENGIHKKGKNTHLYNAKRNAPLSDRFLEYIDRLRSNETDLMEDVMFLLERDSLSFFNHAGKVKCAIVRVLAEINLSIDVKQRLQTIILSVVDTYYVYGFEHYCHLASRIVDPALRRELFKRLEHSDYHVQRRARLVLDALEKNGDL